MTQFLLWPRRPGDRVWPVRLWESAEQLRNKELLQAGIQISLEEKLQLHGGNPGQATRARQTTGPSAGRQKTRLPGCGGTGPGERANPIPTKCVRQSCLPGSRRSAPIPAPRWISPGNGGSLPPSCPKPGLYQRRDENRCPEPGWGRGDAGEDLPVPREL